MLMAIDDGIGSCDGADVPRASLTACSQLRNHAQATPAECWAQLGAVLHARREAGAQERRTPAHHVAGLFRTEGVAMVWEVLAYAGVGLFVWYIVSIIVAVFEFREGTKFWRGQE